MKETIVSALNRLGITTDQFCELAAISRDDLHAIDEGAAVPSIRTIAILRLVKSAGRDKVRPIVALLQGPVAREWRAITAFPQYEVSDDGHVRRRGSSGRGSVRTLKPVLSTDGYLRVTLYCAGKPLPQRIHRLVCEAFHGPAPNGRPYACHRNGQKAENRKANLYWGSAADNASDWQSVRRERMANAVHRKYTPAWRRQLRALDAMRKSAK